jgi:hypothetical protein
MAHLCLWIGSGVEGDLHPWRHEGDVTFPGQKPFDLRRHYRPMAAQKVTLWTARVTFRAPTLNLARLAVDADLLGGLRLVATSSGRKSAPPPSATST